MRVVLRLAVLPQAQHKLPQMVVQVRPKRRHGSFITRRHRPRPHPRRGRPEPRPPLCAPVHRRACRARAARRRRPAAARPLGRQVKGHKHAPGPLLLPALAGTSLLLLLAGGGGGRRVEVACGLLHVAGEEEADDHHLV